MTEDQKDKALLLEILHASRAMPRTAVWIENEMRLAGRRGRDIHTLLRDLERAGLCCKDEDSLGIERWLLSEAGRNALDEL